MTWLSEYRKMYNKNIQEAKFKIGEKVIFHHRDLEIPITGNITAVSNTGDGIEYLVRGADFLAWEEELTSLEKELK